MSGWTCVRELIETEKAPALEVRTSQHRTTLAELLSQNVAPFAGRVQPGMVVSLVALDMHGKRRQRLPCVSQWGQAPSDDRACQDKCSAATSRCYSAFGMALSDMTTSFSSRNALPASYVHLVADCLLTWSLLLTARESIASRGSADLRVKVDEVSALAIE